jgi:hypothetical protein
MAGDAEVGIDEVHLMPSTKDPVRFIDSLGEYAIGQLAELTSI